MDLKEIRKVYVDRHDKGIVECRYCMSSRIVNAAKYRNRKGPLKVRCTCGKTFFVSFEWRRASRKETYLEGYWSKLPECKGWTRILVKDISDTGVAFTALGGHHLKERDKVKVRLVKDDRRGTEIEKTAIVRRVMQNHYVGCEFVSSA
jgi:hypothetical protein